MFRVGHLSSGVFVAAFCVGLLALPGRAAAQGGSDWQRGTALAVFGGGGAADSHVGGALGASIAWEVWPQVTFEGSGTWVMEEGESTGFAGLLGARIGLVPRATLVPFVSAALGVYRTSVDVGAEDLPAFYADRLSTSTESIGTEVFNDFLLSFGGGADVYLTRHLALRPDVRVFIAMADGNARPITVFGVHLAYHFEDHPVTPRRGPRAGTDWHAGARRGGGTR